MNDNRIAEINDALECLADLEAALHAHVEWVRTVHRVLIFRDPPGPTILDPEARRLCLFGRWYDSVDIPEIRESPSYREIAVIHEKVHELAADTVLSAMAGRTDEASYEAFTAYAAHLTDLMHRLEGAVWSSISTRDSLTGLSNRQAMEAFVRRGPPAGGAVALCDIDHFKRINDTYGHQIGDDVLRVVAQSLMGQLRTTDTAFRYGGEEFLIHLGAVEPVRALAICERLREAVEALEIPAGHGRTIRVTASFGVAAVGDLPLNQAIGKADAALYLAKNTGRNRVCAA